MTRRVQYPWRQMDGATYRRLDGFEVRRQDAFQWVGYTATGDRIGTRETPTQARKMVEEKHPYMPATAFGAMA